MIDARHPLETAAQAGPPVVADARRRPTVHRPIPTLAALAGWATCIVIARAWGVHLLAEGRKIVLPTPPVLGNAREALPSQLSTAVLVAAVLVLVLPVAARRLPWRRLAPLATLAAVVWWLVLALLDGTEKLSRGLDWDTDYRPVVAHVSADPLGFLRGYVEHLPSYEVQLRGHPPGFTMLLGLLDRLGLQGPGWAAGLVLLSAAASIPALLLIVHRLCGDRTARRALPFIVLSPAALWIATSTDAFYLGITTWMLALLIVAMDRRVDEPSRAGDLLAVAAGVLVFATMMMSYGLVLLAIGPALIARHRRRLRPLIIAAAVALAGVGLTALLGFWWIDGLLATRHAYDTLDLDRPYGYFFVNNIGAWALALGPAVAVALTRLRDRRLWLLAGAGLGAAALANLSGMSEGEVERIWLPFTVLVLPATAVLVGTNRWATSAWLSLQAGSALLLTALVNLRW